MDNSVKKWEMGLKAEGRKTKKGNGRREKRVSGRGVCAEKWKRTGHFKLFFHISKINPSVSSNRTVVRQTLSTFSCFP